MIQVVECTPSVAVSRYGRSLFSRSSYSGKERATIRVRYGWDYHAFTRSTLEERRVDIEDSPEGIYYSVLMEGVRLYVRPGESCFLLWDGDETVMKP